MTNRSSQIINSVVKALCTLSVFIMLFISVFVYKMEFGKFLIMLAFFIFYVQVPGLFICSSLNLNFKHFSEKLLISMFVGWALVVLEYFIADFLTSNILTYTVGPILSILFICQYFKKSNSQLRLNIKPAKISAGVFIFLVLALLYALLNTQYLYLNPDYSQNIYISIDKAYQMGIINSLAYDFPVLNPWVSGRLINYHFFTQLVYSVPLRLFGIEPDFIIMSFGPFLTVYSIGLSFYSLFKHFSKDSSRVGFFLVAVFLSYMFVARDYTTSYVFRMIFTNDNYAGYSMALAGAWVILFDIYSYDSHKKSKRNEFIILLALMFLLCGVKAPVALVLCGGLWGTWLFGLFFRKSHKEELALVVLSTLAFTIIYKLVVASASTTKGGSSSLIKFGKMTEICFWKDPLINLINSYHIPGIGRITIIMIVFFLFYLSAFCIPFVVGYIREFVLIVSRKKDFDFARVLIYASVCVGIIMLLLLNYSGHSQIYFGLVATNFAPLIVLWFFEDIYKNKAGQTSFSYKVFMVIFVLGLTVSTCLLAMYYAEAIPEAAKYADGKLEKSPYKTLTAEEYEAMNWINENVDEEDLLATQMYRSTSEENYNVKSRWLNCHFIYAAFSERNFYLEGSGFSLEDNEWPLRAEMISLNDQLYDPDNDERSELAEDLSVDYVVVSKKILDVVPDLSGDGYEKCFSNKDIDIYKVNY